MGALTAEQIFGADDIDLVELEIPEWGGSVFIRTMTGAERDRFEASMVDAGGVANRLINLRARMAVIVCCDSEGNRLFKTEECAQLLGGKSAAALDRVYDKSKEMSRLDDDSIEEAEKNFDSGQSDDSGSS